MNLKKQFIQFLKDNNAYYEFEHNLSTKFHYYISMFSLKQSTSIIDDAFIWRETREGFSFWSEIDQKWRKQTFKLLLPYLISTIKKYHLYDNFILFTHQHKTFECLGLNSPSLYLHKIYSQTDNLNSKAFRDMVNDWKLLINKNFSEDI